MPHSDDYSQPGHSGIQLVLSGMHLQGVVDALQDFEKADWLVWQALALQLSAAVFLRSLGLSVAADWMRVALKEQGLYLLFAKVGVRLFCWKFVELVVR